MAIPSKSRTGMSLEEFLGWNRIDDKPYLEYVHGRIKPKVSPENLHSLTQGRMYSGLNVVAEPAGLGYAFLELRCTFPGLSIVPDIAFSLTDHILLDARGRPKNEVHLPPDIHVEIRSPRQTVNKTRAKLTHSVSNGCPLGWFLDPDRETMDGFGPGQAPERLPADGILDGSPVLPGFRRLVFEIFGMLIFRKPPQDEPGGEAR